MTASGTAGSRAEAVLLGICLHLLTLLSYVGFILRRALSTCWQRWYLCSRRVSSHQSSGEFLLLNNSSKSLGVESQGLSLGHMTMTEAIAMISLVMCMTQPQEPGVGRGRRKALAAKVRDAVYMRGAWRMEPGCLGGA